MKFETIEEACREWVNTFNQVPQQVLEKLISYGDYIEELTPPSLYDRVYIYAGEHAGEHGEIVETNYDGEDNLYRVKLDWEEDTESVISSDCFEVERDGFFPMWSTMWTFGSNFDEDYARDHLQEMADCGFRIYEQEDYGLLFGIDGAGYSFFDEHWIPLYKAFGLRWHE